MSDLENPLLDRTRTHRRPGLIAEFIAFIGTNQKWWLGPLVFLFVLIGLLVAGGGSAAAPFIYTLF